MKNRFKKGAHLSERKFTEILKYFCEDRTASKIAGMTGVSRVTVNRYLQVIRARIATNAETHPSIDALHPFVQTAPLQGSTPVLSANVVFGVSRIDNEIRVAPIPAPNLILLKDQAPQAAIRDLWANEPWKNYPAIIHISERKLFHNRWLQETGVDSFLWDEMDRFWMYTQKRLVKFKGVVKNTVFLHLKESEFRYNHLREDLYPLLLAMFNTMAAGFSGFGS